MLAGCQCSECMIEAMVSILSWLDWHPKATDVANGYIDREAPN